jgi:hypothetical protein
MAEADDDDTPRKKARRRDDEEDERPRKKKKKRYADDDDYNHDRPRRRRPNKSGGGGAMIAVLVIGGFVLLIGVGAAIYFLAGKGGLPFVKKAPPRGWQQHTSTSAGMKVYMPTKPTEMTVPGSTGVNDDQPFGAGGDFQSTPGSSEAESTTVIATNIGPNAVRTVVIVVRYRKDVPAVTRDKIRNLDPSLPGTQARSMRWLGYDGVEITSTKERGRIIATERDLIVAVIFGPYGTRATTAEEEGFLDNIELTK